MSGPASIGQTNGILLISKDTSGFTSNTLLIRDSILLQYIMLDVRNKTGN